MPLIGTLPPNFVWRVIDDQVILLLDSCHVARIRPMGAGWVMETLVEAPGLAAHQVAVRSVAAGQRWATRWAKERQRLIAAACGRPDLAPAAPPTPSSPRRRWQAPTWRRAS